MSRDSAVLGYRYRHQTTLQLEPAQLLHFAERWYWDDDAGAAVVVRDYCEERALERVDVDEGIVLALPARGTPYVASLTPHYMLLDAWLPREGGWLRYELHVGQPLVGRRTLSREYRQTVQALRLGRPLSRHLMPYHWRWWHRRAENADWRSAGGGQP